MVAAYRARASVRDRALCNDPWAAALTGEDGTRLADEFDLVVPFMELLIAVRTAFFDEQVRYWTVDHDPGPGEDPATRLHALDQVAIVGAGLDSRAARLGRKGVTFYEVDHPGSLQYKQERVRVLDGYADAAVTYVPCDLEEQDLIDVLSLTPFASRRPALFVCEGVVPYLPQEAVRRMFSGIAATCHERSVVVFDHVAGAVDGDLSPRQRRVEQRMESLGEPLRFGRADVLGLLRDAGFTHTSSVGLESVRERLTGEPDPAAQLRFQRVTSASRSRLPGGDT
jgi:methyltransferase (TIGR00027 family)